MKELSLNILDITQNSITARAKNILISLVEDNDGWLTLTIKDDGCGMSEEILRTVMDPFYTTRTTRKVGMGIPLLKLACEQTGGKLTIVSKDEKTNPLEHGTTLCATFDTRHIDMTPVGDMVSTVEVLLQGHPEVDYMYVHKTPRFSVEMDTKELRAVLGDISLGEVEVLQWVRGFLEQQYDLSE